MPAAPLRIALAQLNATVGDLSGNEAKAREAIAAARDAGAQLVVFPELFVCGYPPEDLLLKESFLRDAQRTVERIAEDAREIVAVIGAPERAEDVYNAAVVLAEGAVQGRYRKVYLPNYGVFDEQRYFQSGRRGGVLDLDGVRIGITICEDIWEPGAPLPDEALAGAMVIVNLSASPYHAGKGIERERMIVQRARDNLAAVALCNLVGGQDELVFDGHSVVVDHEGAVLARAPQFAEHLLVAEIDPGAPASARLRDTRHRPVARLGRAEAEVVAALELPERREEPDPEEGDVADLLEPVPEVYAALVCGTRDYVDKNGFQRVVLGLSGGIDSALVACVAVDALGAERVVVAIMPSPYSSSGTQDDARALARNLGVEVHEFDIRPAMEAYDALLEPAFRGREPDITEENLQARIRGNLLMALSNKFGWLVLTTSNKSEASVGYSTLYGDMAGGFAVIKDVPKLLVYDLVRHRNAVAEGDLVPPSILERPPSAELRPDQRDEDSLPPYPVLDAIIEGYVERDLDREQLANRGLDPDEIDRTLRLVDRAEYKRRQAPPGVKITARAFGRDRRMPITNRYDG